MHDGRYSRWAVIGMMVFAVWASITFRYVGVPGNDWHEAINNDGTGYYGYLRLFLFSDMPQQGAATAGANGPAPVINYFSGTAVLMAPFVLVAHAYTLLNGSGPEDGFSLHYQAAVGFSCLFYLTIGLLALRRTLLVQGFDDRTVAIALLALTLGTGLITQAVEHPAMSHVYGFAVIALLFRSVQVLLLAPTGYRLVICAALLALAMLIRPVNGLVLLALPLSGYNITFDGSRVLEINYFG
ncbi:MAG TPA: hypothetical protein PK760_02570 [Flavobacteriales bacterium]|nr:hypothetical protein [Flavobacteriales bacterium]